ncbi:putative protoheme IX synthesis protein [Oleiphilus messinensis]|uniref:Putative protoheme IX synthesis protein n=1 Tax=Oleiphilus messinensis TaxID=141451 RepID=A0A1Y0I4Y5_9GAMM|nr:heme biosynthesis HemY N-terminal domain-containing protein [Oleiphilus messinensis]ARU54473.1 putative protoheme IX synthesis protein [Oleiphilus messinensis]
MKTVVGLIILAGALLLGTLAGTLMLHDAGYVRVSLGHYMFESSFWFALCLIIGLFATIYLIFALLFRSLRGFQGISQWIDRKSQDAANREVTKGMLEYTEGNWPKALKHLKGSASKANSPIVNYLAAAQAANEQGLVHDAEEMLQKAREVPGSELAVGLTEAQLMVNNNQLESAVEKLKTLHSLAPQNPQILRQLKALYSQLQDWPQLTQLIPELRKKKIFVASELDELEQQCWTNVLQETTESIQKTMGSSYNPAQLEAVWEKIPSDLRKSEPLLLAYSASLRAIKHDDRAEMLLRKTLKQNWNDQLVLEYGLIRFSSPIEQLETAERWLESRPGNAELLLTVGRLALRTEGWHKAREYFEASLKFKKRMETYAELSRLCAHLGQLEQSTEYFMQGVLGQAGLPELPMPAKQA